MYTFKTPALQAAYERQDGRAFAAAADEIATASYEANHGGQSLVEMREAAGFGKRFFASWTAGFELTPAGTHDGIRDGASTRRTHQAGTKAWSAKALLAE
jgi:hypothetical protein